MDFTAKKFWYRRGDDFTKGTDWSDNAVRRRFICKVCLIVASQLVITAAFTAVCLKVEPMREFMLKHWYITYIGLAGAALVSLMLLCFLRVARTVPWNYILLVVHTICMSLIAGSVAVKYKTDMVLYALGITAAVVVALIIFARFIPCDITRYGPYLCVIGLLLMLLGVVMFFVQSKILNWIYVCVALLLFSVYFVYDVQLLIGRHSNEFSEEDYIIAALCIYSDIVQIFMQILALLATGAGGAQGGGGCSFSFIKAMIGLTGPAGVSFALNFRTIVPPNVARATGHVAWVVQFIVDPMAAAIDTLALN